MAVKSFIMQPTICIMLILLNEFAVTHGLTIEEKTSRKLNTRPYDRVINIISAVSATTHIQPVGVQVNTECQVIYFDKTCANENYGVDHLSSELIKDIVECYDYNPRNPDINKRNALDYYIFVSLNMENALCHQGESTNTIMIDMEAFCISQIEHEPIYAMDDIDRQTNPIPWGLELVEKIHPDMTAYSGYHYNTFEHNNVNIYILDQKVLLTHTEFADIQTKAYLNGDGGPNVPYDHGTHVAGTVCGRTVGMIRDGSIGLYSYGCCQSSGSCYWADITAGFNAAIAHMEANPDHRGVINYSVGGGLSNGYDTFLSDIKAANGIFVTSAGNSNTDACQQSPAHHPDAISVASYTSSNTRSSFSNYGNCVDAYAPGSNVYSSAVTSTYGYMSGTSMASPAIAGAVARLLSRNNALTFTQIKSILSCSEYGTPISNALSPVNVGFGTAVGDIDRVAGNPAQCNSLATINAIVAGESVTGNIPMIGQRDHYRVKITSGANEDITFVSTSGLAACLSFYDLNFNPIGSAACYPDPLVVASVSDGDYWLCVAGDISSMGEYTVRMNAVGDTPQPTTPNPSTSPTTDSPSESPITKQPTNNPTTSRPTTPHPTTSPTTDSPSRSPTTDSPTISCLAEGTDCSGGGTCCVGFVCKRQGWRNTCKKQSGSNNGVNVDDVIVGDVNVADVNVGDVNVGDDDADGKVKKLQRVEYETLETDEKWTRKETRREYYEAHKKHGELDGGNDYDMSMNNNNNNESDSFANIFGDGNDNVSISIDPLALVTVFTLIGVIGIGICYGCYFMYKQI